MRRRAIYNSGKSTNMVDGQVVIIHGLWNDVFSPNPFCEGDYTGKFVDSRFDNKSLNGFWRFLPSTLTFLPDIYKVGFNFFTNVDDAIEHATELSRLTQSSTPVEVI